jgi:Family of unknown function (DUF6065)
MDSTPVRFANRCLPLKIANQSGWVIRSGCSFSAQRTDLDTAGFSVMFEFHDDAPPDAASVIQDLFGLGLITFHLPYLFRTDPGYALIARGAPNFIVKNAHPLEGVIETDWTPATFTMNWRILEEGATCVFRCGDPLCFIQPIQLGILESFEPHVESIESDAELSQRYQAWKTSRLAFNMNPDRQESDWQKDYYRGLREPSVEELSIPPEHRTRIKLRKFPMAYPT